jgi:hypothetical protein
MPHTVTVTKRQEGERFLILHVFIKGDGLSADLAAYPLVDPTTLNPAKPLHPCLAIDEVWYDLDGFNMRLDYDSVTDPPAWTASQGGGGCHVDFSPMGGIADKSGLDGTGKLLLSTSGLDTAAKQGTLILKLRKK